MLAALGAGLLGLIIGSFLNVCIYRLPLELSVVLPRSYCPECKRQIAWYDNVPLLSYLLLGGRCRHCRSAISIRYPLVELLTGVLFFLAVWLEGTTPQALKMCLFSALLVELAVSDFESLFLPDVFTFGGIAIGVLTAALVPMEPGLISLLFQDSDWRVISVAESIGGAAFASLALWLVGWIYLKIRHREGLGFGDVKLIALIGAFLGMYRTVFVLMLGSIAGSIIGLSYIYLARKDPSTYELPYGTFLSAAALVYIFAGRYFLS